MTVFPVPVTAFNQMVETDISKMAMATTFKTGMAISRKTGSVFDIESNSLEKKKAGMKMNKVVPMLSFDIFMINGFTK